MPDIRHLHNEDEVELYLTIPICKTSVIRENAVYKIVDYHGTSLRITASTGLPMSRNDIIAIPEHYPEDGIRDLYRQLRQIRYDKLQDLSSKELYLLQGIVDKTKA